MPAEPGNSPTLTSGKPTIASMEAMCQWQAVATLRHRRTEIGAFIHLDLLLRQSNGVGPISFKLA